MLRRELRLSGRKDRLRLAGVAQRLETPLTSIRMYAELLRDHDAELAPARRRGYQQIILDESERLSRLVGNVLDFSRLDAGRKRYSPAETDLAELLNTAAELCRERARTGVEFHVSLPGSPASCRIDRDSLLQILHNLFDNAFKYAASGKRIDLSLVRAGRRWEIRLRDYGPGVPPGAEEKIFSAEFLPGRHGAGGRGFRFRARAGHCPRPPARPEGGAESRPRRSRHAVHHSITGGTGTWNRIKS
ncbi:MAG: histidine kinase dimerization/phospho-acceptor domain-containing protein [Victivallis sp.]